MKLSDYNFNLPKELIAQSHIQPRDHSRLLILNSKTGSIEHKHFFDLTEYLKPGDVLVVNDSKVFPARLIGFKEKTKGKMEIFLHHKNSTESINGVEFDIWECMVGGRGACEGQVVIFKNNLTAVILKNNQDGTWLVRFDKANENFFESIQEIGIMPLPPYIKRGDDGNEDDKVNYQTVYANKVGSAAAPTAGLHFTEGLLNKIKEKQVEIVSVTLHVGLGTFAPVKTDNILEHKMHSEYAEVKREMANKIILAKKAGRRIVAVGTTSARVLEGLIPKINEETYKNKETVSDLINIFIYPGYKFEIVDCLITNFHLPKSTLLMLVSALAGKENIEKAYNIAVENEYRFFSYGDAMFIN